MYFLLAVVVSMGFGGWDAHAEVRVSERGVTANLTSSSLAQAVTQVARQADIHIVVMNTPTYHTAVISDVFEGLPLEMSLERLLNGWNYGWSKDPISGAVRSLIIVSQRSSSLKASALTSESQVSLNTNTIERQSENLLDESEPAIVYEEPYLTEEELIENTPPELREMIANSLQH